MLRFIWKNRHVMLEKYTCNAGKMLKKKGYEVWLVQVVIKIYTLKPLYVGKSKVLVYK